MDGISCLARPPLGGRRCGLLRPCTASYWLSESVGWMHLLCTRAASGWRSKAARGSAPATHSRGLPTWRAAGEKERPVKNLPRGRQERTHTAPRVLPFSRKNFWENDDDAAETGCWNKQASCEFTTYKDGYCSSQRRRSIGLQWENWRAPRTLETIFYEN